MRQSALITAALVLALAPLAPAQVRTTGPMVTRQTTAQRTARTPRAGEMVYDTTTGALYVGDGTTAGGVSPYLYSALPNGGAFRPISIQPAQAGQGPLVFGASEPAFNGNYDPVVGWGYNQDAGGGLIQSGEPGLRWNVEGDYNDGANRTMESYLQYRSADTLTTIRPLFFQFNRGTNTLSASQLLGSPLHLQDSDGTDTGLFSKAGVTLIAPAISLNSAAGTTMAQSVPNTFQVNAVGTSADTNLAVLAASGRASHLQMGNNGTANVYSINTVTASPSTLNHVLNGNTVLTLYASPNGASGAAIAVGTGSDNTATGVFSQGSSANSVKGLVVRARSTTSASLFEAQDSSSVAYFTLDKRGRPVTANTTPTIAAGTGAGTSPTVSVSGTDVNGTITVTTGTGPAAAATVATITFSTAWGAAPKSVLITPANPATAAIWGTTTLPYVDSAGISTTKFDVSIGAGGLGASTTYKIYYDVKG
jgi:hypothetical protein